MIKEISVFLENEKSTSELGLKLSERLTSGLLIFLKGDLGAGKTCLVRSLLTSLGYQGKVKSPSYSLFEQYNISDTIINHFDLYRFKSAEEWLSAGFNDYINAYDITIIEWPERAENVLCEPDIEIEIMYENDINRKAFIRAQSKKGEVACKGLI
ncbi:MAG: tRNA (adenosine(37)-N6)-threonylcarbamoyltransferase complex ATPase subunit type 1 TsaE [Nitrosomonadales bacterium]|jgi:tRNA threonylcarbamoyladenosine biosynthesis protein TsaE|nr:tRNA (adenosine(37)-N6)-threonylcarbamoyltransferase complex ATPase subunit type 1 TsaE [Nitrosomonadales bacterium]MBT3918739.1 tRNA (adenosine(37)-N6)-threonylcarbamoyltransferase complex ATPase subunit type 1 TsaE [Nitrosomonadales bacterium]MBT4182681.1 tRNA (adenosine(37)-N6)-threonylcarbamoyltransferase complex ATPase subunit type 1 TsaE [Nitrosomonadales bacterium]MBT4571455.1 tRNA (adenosine(37)-N6)-threonylcarbamoyltransferase complex ATPase subunit type 1 TsaE [Nitrosomonadales bact